MNGWLLLFVALAGAMAAATALFVRWASEARSALKASVVVFLLLMMTGMLVGGLVYELSPGATSAIAGLWVAAAIMSASVVLVFVSFLGEVRRAAEGPAASAASGASRLLVVSVVLLVVLNEFLMGWTLGLASGELSRGFGSGAAPVGAWGGAVVVSPWFVFTMAAEMILTVTLLRRALPRSAVALLGAQALLMLLSPPAFPTRDAASVALSAGSAAMIGLVVFLMELLYRRRSLSEAFLDYVGRLLAVYALMMAGLFLWVLYGSPLLFAVSVLIEMVVFFHAIVRPASLGAEPVADWQSRSGWTFGFLLWIFVAELFMGATLAFELTPGQYLPGPLLALQGSSAEILSRALANGLFFVTDTTASTWFLLMMGVEMGALVVLRMREVRGRGHRLRLGLMLGCYGAFAIFYPSIYYAGLFPHAPGAGRPWAVPVLGWSMGIGSAPIGPEVFGAIAATYLVFSLATVLFGRRAICSTFCTAATMYQGTTLDAMKNFHRTSRLARPYRGSRLGSAYRLTAGAVMVAFVGTSLLSYLDQTGRLAVTVGGVDPTVLFFDLSFGVLWYVLFVTVPYAGVYNCVSMGWCYTGLLAGATSSVGFFRLKVHDREVCRRCTTLDCARGCPVGLNDMPAQFRTKGEFRSSKCCGIGDCAEDCPYGNLYLADVRHTLRSWWDGRHGRRGVTVLPMAGAPSPLVEAGPASPTAAPASAGRTAPRG